MSSRRKLYKKPTYFRSAVAYQNELEISEEGGEFDAGYIKNVSIIAQGEALGHGMWIDDVFANQVALQLAEADAGIKVRFTHPDMSGDGLAKGMGRAFYKKKDKNKVYADIHFWKSAHDGPDGNLAGYVIQRAKEDPSSFGMSISFQQDLESQAEFVENNSEDGAFGSPDPNNLDNLPHVRLSKLRAADFVDEPAANPDGLFCVDETFKEAEQMLSFALGLTEEQPETCSFGIDPSRAAGFVQRFMESRKMKIQFQNAAVAEVEQPEQEAVNEDAVVQEAVAEETQEAIDAGEQPVEITPEDADPVEALAEGDEAADVKEAGLSSDNTREDLERFVSAFGVQFGTKAFLDGKSYEETSAEYISALSAENRQLVEAMKLKQETEEASLSAGGEDVEEKEVGFASNIIGRYFK